MEEEAAGLAPVPKRPWTNSCRVALGVLALINPPTASECVIELKGLAKDASVLITLSSSFFQLVNWHRAGSASVTAVEIMFMKFGRKGSHATLVLLCRTPAPDR